MKEFWPFLKVAKKVATSVGYFSSKKCSQMLQKVAKMAKFRQIWSH